MLTVCRSHYISYEIGYIDSTLIRMNCCLFKLMLIDVILVLSNLIYLEVVPLFMSALLISSD